MIFSITPFPIRLLSISPTAFISAAVPVKNTSSAKYNSSFDISRISVIILSSLANLNTVSRVIPSNAPEAVGGVIKTLFLTIKIFSPLASTTIPSVFSMRASSNPAFIASILAKAEFA